MSDTLYDETAEIMGLYEGTMEDHGLEPSFGDCADVLMEAYARAQGRGTSQETEVVRIIAERAACQAETRERTRP